MEKKETINMSKLTLNRITELKNEMYTMEKFFVNDTDYIEYYVKFPKTIVDEAVEDALKITNQAKEDGKILINNDLELKIFMNFMIIKHFTNLKEQLDGLDYQTHVAVMSEMIDNRLYAMIIQNFDKDEVQMVHDLVSNLLTVMQEAQKQVEIENKKAKK